MGTVVSFDDRWLNKPGPLDLCLRRNIFQNAAVPYPADSKDPGVQAITAAGPNWSEEETLRLLEGLERYGENWTDVQRHVGSDKTVEQCVAHFLQMPIEDAYLDDQYRVKPTATTDGATKAETGGSAGAPAPLPLESAGNPLLAQLALLNTSGPGPEVAAAAAAAALKVYTKARDEQKGCIKSGVEDAPAA